MLKKLINRSLQILIIDAILAAMAWLMAYWFRLNLSIHHIQIQFIYSALFGLPVILLCQTASNITMRTYRGMWRFFSLYDCTRIIKSIAIGTLCSLSILFLLRHQLVLPRSVPILYTVFLFTLMSGTRAFYRYTVNINHRFLDTKKRALIIGAGAAGEHIAREFIKQKESSYFPVGFLDDAAHLQKHDIHGIPVIGKIEDVVMICEQLNIDLIIIAIPSLSTKRMQSIVSLCHKTHTPFRTLPGLNQITDGKVSLNALKKVEIEDLLYREQIKTNTKQTQILVANKVILVTGGGGSIGSELCRQIITLNPKKLIILDHSEYNLYKIAREFHEKQYTDFECVLTSILDLSKLTGLFEKHQIDLIFHAAAYKHVPILEVDPVAAIQNNAIGTIQLATLASKYQIKKFVLVSTDKAVNPTNIMGTTKRIAELACQSMDHQSNTAFISVRFGNVLGSTGSVVPLFEKQLRAGGPLTVTDPNVTRYFMTIPEAVGLIIESATLGNDGEIFILDMGNPIKIIDLAKRIIELSGKNIDDVGISIVGLRPGEKLFEELSYDKEKVSITKNQKIWKLNTASIDKKFIKHALTHLKVVTMESDTSSLTETLLQLVPEASLSSYEDHSPIVIS